MYIYIKNRVDFSCGWFHVDFKSNSCTVIVSTLAMCVCCEGFQCFIVTLVSNLELVSWFSALISLHPRLKPVPCCLHRGASFIYCMQITSGCKLHIYNDDCTFISILKRWYLMSHAYKKLKSILRISLSFFFLLISFMIQANGGE